MEFKEWVFNIAYLFCFGNFIYERNKYFKKWKQAEQDYNDLLEQTKELVHENNILKNQSADTK